MPVACARCWRWAKPPRGGRAYCGAILAMAVFQAVLAAAQHFLLRHDLLTDLRPFVGLVTGAHWPLAQP